MRAQTCVGKIELFPFVRSGSSGLDRVWGMVYVVVVVVVLLDRPINAMKVGTINPLCGTMHLRCGRGFTRDCECTRF